MKLIALAYGRQSVARSRDANDGGSVSIAYQRQAAEAWCNSHDATLAGWFQDSNISGADPGRAGLASLVKEAERVRPAFVLFWDLKRLSRNLKLFLDLFDAFERSGSELVSCTEGTRHPAFVWKLLALVGEEERERIAVNITHGIRESAKRGRHHGYAPIGYALTETSELVIDPETHETVAWLFARALAGRNPTAICREANARGLPTPTRSGPWSRQAVLRILTNPVYAGFVQAGGKSATRYGQSLPTVLAVGSHEPIVEHAAWQAVQDALRGRQKASRRRDSTHWLAGRVDCSCGARLYYVDATRKDGPWHDRYWRCAKTYGKTFGIPSPHDGAKRIADTALRSAVVEALSTALSQRMTVDEALAALEASGASAARTLRQTTERDLAELQRQRIRITDAIQYGAGDIADLAVRDRDLIARIEALSALLECAPVAPNPATLNAAYDALGTMEDVLIDADDDGRAVIAVELGLRVRVDLATGGVSLSYRSDYARLMR